MTDSTFCLVEKTKYTKLEETSVLRKYTVYTTPSEGGTGPFVSGSRLTFNFDTRGFIDFSSLRFQGRMSQVKLSIPPNEDTTFRWKFKTCFGSVIKNIQVKMSGVTVVDIPSYNIWLAFSVNATTPRTHLMTQKSLLEGYIDIETFRNKYGGKAVEPPANVFVDYVLQTPFDANTLNVETDVRYTESHKFDVGFFNILKYFPAHLVQRFQLILDLAAPNDAIGIYFKDSTVGANQTDFLKNNVATYSISDPKIFYDIVEMDKVFEDSVRLIASENALYIPFLQIGRHAYTQPPGVINQAQNLSLSEKVGSLKGVYMLCFDQRWDNRNNVGAANEHFGFIDDDNTGSDELVGLQFKIGGQLHPTYNITSTIEVAAQYFLAMGNFNDNRGQCGINGSAAGFSYAFFSTGGRANKYVLPNKGKYRLMSVLAYDFDREECPDLITGYNTVGNQSDITIRYVPYTDLPEYNITSTRAIHVWTLFNATLRILGNGKVDILR